MNTNRRGGSQAHGYVVGQTYGIYKILKTTGEMTKNGKFKMYKVECALCGRKSFMSTVQICKGKHCDCWKNPLIKLTGYIGKGFTVIKFIGQGKYETKCNNCGKIVVNNSNQLRYRLSCGCIKSISRKRKPGSMAGIFTILGNLPLEKGHKILYKVKCILCGREYIKRYTLLVAKRKYCCNECRQVNDPIIRKPGTVIGGFVLMEYGNTKAPVKAKCLKCGKVVEKTIPNMHNTRSCGCTRFDMYKDRKFFTSHQNIKKLLSL